MKHYGLDHANYYSAPGMSLNALLKLTDVLDIIHKMETMLTDTKVNEILGTINNPPLPVWEILWLNKMLQTICGELTNNLAKLTKLEELITKDKRKLVQVNDSDEFNRCCVAEHLQNLGI